MHVLESGTNLNFTVSSACLEYIYSVLQRRCPLFIYLTYSKLRGDSMIFR